jgi:hypothetical protein
MSPLEKELDFALRALYHEWKPIWRAGRFWRMLTSKDRRYGKGPVKTVKHLLESELCIGSGFMRLRKAGRLDLTVEHLVQNPKWRPLFSDQEL